MFDLKPKTIHFGLAYFLPLDNLTFQGLSLLETNLQSNGLQIIGKICPNLDSIQMNFKTDDGAVFILKIEKVGEIRTAEKEPIYALSVISGEDGNENMLDHIYALVLSCIPDDCRISGFSIRREATLRKLYGPVPSGHAFQFLWENILKQNENTLKVFNGIAGGGLRFVPSPRQTTFNSVSSIELLQIEYKVESFLRDPRYMFIESIYTWPEPFHFKDMSSIKSSVKPRCDYMLNDITTTIECFLRSL